MDTEYLSAVNDAGAAACALAERAFVHALNGGCSSPVAAYAVTEGEKLTLTGLYVSPDERIVRKGSIEGLRSDAKTLGRTLAEELKGAQE